MKRLTSLLFMLLLSLVIRAQTFEQIELQIKILSYFLQLTQSQVNEFLINRFELEYIGRDEFRDGKLIKTYFNPKYNSLVIMEFQSSSIIQNQNQKVLVAIGEIFYYSTNQFDLFRQYIDKRSLYVKAPDGTYIYLGTENLLYESLNSLGYYVWMNINEIIDISSKYGLFFRVTIRK